MGLVSALTRSAGAVVVVVVILLRLGIVHSFSIDEQSLGWEGVRGDFRVRYFAE